MEKYQIKQCLYSLVHITMDMYHGYFIAYFGKYGHLLLK